MAAPCVRVALLAGSRCTLCPRICLPRPLFLILKTVSILCIFGLRAGVLIVFQAVTCRVEVSHVQQDLSHHNILTRHPGTSKSLQRKARGRTVKCLFVLFADPIGCSSGPGAAGRAELFFRLRLRFCLRLGRRRGREAADGLGQRGLVGQRQHHLFEVGLGQVKRRAQGVRWEYLPAIQYKAKRHAP